MYVQLHRKGPTVVFIAATIAFQVLSRDVVAFAPSNTAAPAPSAIDLSYLVPAETPALAPSPNTSPVTAIFPTLPGAFKTKASNAVVDWNLAVQWTLRTTNGTNIAPRIFAIVSLGVLQALEANTGLKSPADPVAVAGLAAHLLMTDTFPNYFSLYNNLLQQQTANLSSEELRKAKAVSDPVVVALLASKLDDGFQDPQPPITQSAIPGQFQDVGSGGFRATRQYATTKPLLLPADLSTVDFIANFSDPDPYPSAGYNAQLTATYLIGNATNSIRTQEQTDTAWFWSDGLQNTSGIPGHWNQLVLASMPANITLYETAELLAKMNVAIYDTTIAVFYLKYKFNRWRPLTAIRTGDADHVPDPTWTPLLVTPNNPTYPSAQGGYAGNGEIILTDFYGSDEHALSLGTEVTPGGLRLQSRSYKSFSNIAAEVTQSRYFGGIENPSDASAGRLVGQNVGWYLLENFDSLLKPTSG